MEEKNTNATKRRNPVTWVPSVYFAMGLPFVVLNMVTVLMFKGLDISDAQIALWTSVIMLPWTLKPLWSPFLEMYRTKKFFVVLTQLLSGCLFGLVALALREAAKGHYPQLIEINGAGKMVWDLNDNATFGMISSICPID